MSVFELNSRDLREVLIFYFHSSKTAAEAHRMLSSTYDEAALSKRTCREWFQCFKSVSNSDSELEALLAEDSCQMQEGLVESLGVTQHAISKRPKAMVMIQKQGNWVPYELKPRDVERRFFTCKQLHQRQNMKGFLHRIVTGDKNRSTKIIPSLENHGECPGHASTSTFRPNIHGAKVMLCIW